MLRTPSAISTQPMGTDTPNTLKMSRDNAYTPRALMSTPESIAEIGAGADGWASGSHAWNGTRAAFRPKPATNKLNANASPGFMPASWIARAI